MGRERRQDVPLLVWWFIHRRQERIGRHDFTEAAVDVVAILTFRRREALV